MKKLWIYPVIMFIEWPLLAALGFEVASFYCGLLALVGALFVSMKNQLLAKRILLGLLILSNGVLVLELIAKGG